MKILLVSLRVDSITEYHETRDSLDQRWYLFLQKINIVPLLVPNIPEQVATYFQLPNIVGVLLTGGNSIAEVPARDQTEQQLLHYAEQHQFPVFGICRGMQMMLASQGIALQPVQDQVQSQQQILINQQPQWVNSYHHWGVQQLPSDFTIFATTLDQKIIKGFYHTTNRWCGLMWHPERLDPIRSDDLNLFKQWFHL